MPHQFTPIDSATGFKFTDNRLELATPSSRLQVVVLAPGTVRVTLLPIKQVMTLPPSLSVATTVWPETEVDCKVTDDGIWLSTSELHVHVATEPLRISFFNPDGMLLTSDHHEKGMGWTCPRRTKHPSGPSGAGVFKSFAPDTRFFGFGERTGGLNKRGTTMSLWNTDVLPHHPGVDSMYISVPFFIAHSEGIAYGSYIDTAARSSFNMGKPPARACNSKIALDPPRAPEVPGGAYWMGVDEPRLDYYFFAGPRIADVVKAYARLTGMMRMPPMWSLGYHQCRFSYCPDSEVREVAKAFRESDIPCDAIYLDIDYMDGFKVFTFDEDHFPDPKGLISDLGEQGYRVVTIVDPGVKLDPDYGVYADGLRTDAFVKDPEGGVLHGRVWPGTVAYPDFLRPEVRHWWAEQHKVLFDAGVSGFWNDMNEPSNFNTDSKTLNLDARHGEDDSSIAHAYVHNAYGNLMAMATQEAFSRFLPGKRPFIITRAGCGGIQRNALAWTGDNSSWWEHIAMAVPMCLNMSLSGISFVGVDIGGFGDDALPELVTRFTQLGAFMPLFRNHSSVNTVAQEPYSLGEPYTSVCRDYIKLRYRLLPYLYTLFSHSAHDGTPIMRPLAYEFPDDPAALDVEDQYMLGPQIMVAPVSVRGAQKRLVYFPAARWLNIVTGHIVAGSGQAVTVDSPLDVMPVYLREGSLMPWGISMNYVDERHQRISVLDVFPASGMSRGEFTMYTDDGASLDYLEGKCAHVRCAYDCASDGLIQVTVDTQRFGYDPELEVGAVRIWGVNRPREIAMTGSLGARTLAFDYDDDVRCVTVRLNEKANELRLDVSFS